MNMIFLRLTVLILAIHSSSNVFDSATATVLSPQKLLKNSSLDTPTTTGTSASITISPNPSDKAVDSGETSAAGDGNNEDVNESSLKDLYEDLEETIVFEDSEHGGQDEVSGALVGQIPNELIENNAAVIPLSGSDDKKSSEYDRVRNTTVSTRDSVTAGSNPVVQKIVKFPEYVKSSSYHKGWSVSNVTRPEALFQFWEPYETVTTLNLSEDCATHMELFQTALRTGKMWAYKMADASGHYGGGYFWGNTFWLGSKSLCSEISHYDKDLPFKIGFNVVRTYIALKNPINVTERYQHIGLCLPYACTATDVNKLVSHSLQHDIPERNANVSKVKSPHEYYDIYKDRTFWLLVIISGLTVILLALGTSLDYYLENNVCKKVNGFMFDNYNFTVNHKKLQPLSEHSKIDIDPVPVQNIEVASESIPRTCSVVDMLLSFSIRRNLKQICDKTIGEDTISTVHGIRSLSMFWIVLGHVCIVSFKYSDNMAFRTVVERELLFQLINKATFSVDTFFFISGLLVSFLYFRTTAKVDVNKLTKATGYLSNFIEFIGLLVYRFCRLTAPYFFALGVVQLTMKWFHYNSVFDPPTDDHINCPNYWWRNLLYINTLYPVQDMCMLWSWYLADDTQFYILGVILLILSARYFNFAAFTLVLCTIASWFTTGYIAYTNKHMPNIDDPLALFDKIYDKPWTRLSPYFVGMAIGWILFKTECKIKMNSLTICMGWAVSLATLASLIFGLHQVELHPIIAAMYSSLSHTLWALCLAWVVVACATGNGGYVNKFLSCSVLIPFSRTTYCAYLVHPIVIRYAIMKRDSPFHLTIESVTLMFLGQLVVSYFFAFLLSIAFEAPFVSLLKLVSPTKRNN